ncbi:MAG: histidine--tRNA ligase [Candidatus Nomurabacteria bacterium]|jgi:histidyl-tRNA synthetase|nr:histidine--tRNA ligase [Candidatus Nomurabacteria bacterium]
MKLDTKSYKGTRDIYPEEMRLRRYIFDKWARVCQRYGYERYDAPILEPLEIYAAKSGQEIVSDQTYAFTDRGDRRVTIRPEMTPSIARMVAARRQEMPMPARLFSIANFMRYERPQKGREREFWQLNLDLFGAADVEADIEIITVSDAILREFGARPEMYTILVGDRRLTDYVMREYLELDAVQAGVMIKLFDRRAKMSVEEFNVQAAEIYGGQNSSEFLAKVDELVGANSLGDLPKTIAQNGPVDELRTLLSALERRGITSAKYDPTLMRGFDYYTGIVFEVFDNSPENNRSMFGGGRYDGLVGLFGVEDLPVCGVAPGEATLNEFLKAWNLLPKLAPATDLYIIPLGIDVHDIADKLRAGGVKVAVDLGGRKAEKAIKTAVKLGVPYVMFVGENELKSGKFSLKNLATKEEKMTTLDDVVAILTNARNVL